MLTLFHTAASNVALFDALLKQLALDIPARHVVDEAILREVRDAGAVTPAAIARVRAALAPLAGPQSFVLCTCSSIGGLAEQAGERVMRVDRPMAEQAVSLGRRITIAATLRSTLTPTQALIQDAARQAGKPVETLALFIPSAWPLIERGDQAGYAREIADRLAKACARPVRRDCAGAGQHGCRRVVVRRAALPHLEQPPVGRGGSRARVSGAPVRHLIFCSAIQSRRILTDYERPTSNAL